MIQIQSLNLLILKTFEKELENNYLIMNGYIKINIIYELLSFVNDGNENINIFESDSNEVIIQDEDIEEIE